MELARTLAGVPARLSSRCALCLAVCWALAAGTVRAYPVGAEVPLRVAELSRKLQASRTSSNFRALEAHADSVAGAERDLALYAIGLARHRARQFPQAEKAFAAIGASGGWLGERAAYYRARCIVLADDFERALGPLQRFEEEHPKSYFAPAAARLRVESLMRLRRLDRARSIVARTPSLLEEPVRLYLAGRIEHLDGRRQQAVKLYREAYYHYPFTDQADAAEAQLDRLRAQLGGAYPDAPSAWRLVRAEKLYEGGQYSRASAEFGRALSGGLQGDDRDQAVIHRAAADHRRGSDSTAYTALARARPSRPDLDAERLYLLCAIERRRRLVKPMLSSLSKLASRHASSPWFQEALLAVGNHYYLRNDRSEYLRQFRRLVDAFPKGRHAPYAHWKLSWRAWLDDAGNRRALLEEHVRRYPGAGTAANALYWLGRLHEREGRREDARAHYRAVLSAFPHYYYAGLARDRLGRLGDGAVNEETVRKLNVLIPKPRGLAERPAADTRAVLEAGTVLHLLGAHTEARREFSRADYRRPGAHFAGLALGRLHAGLGQHHLALRAMKRYAYGYLRFPLDSLDMDYWRYLFPMPWEKSLRARSKRHKLDPSLVAGLIRQESEFNPGARSRAGALGLMQVMPRTGRSLFRRLGIPAYSNRKLTDPEVSLRLGTFHLKESLAKFGGRVERALAGYNAGDSRVVQWMKLGPFDEPAEFVETIPFSETRGYVQSVLRNRAMYERVYGD